MKKVFIVSAEFEEAEPNIFTSTDVETILDEQLKYLREQGYLYAYNETEVGEATEELQAGLESLKAEATTSKQFVVFADLGNDRKKFHGVFSTVELAEQCIETTDKAYGFNPCYYEETELDIQHD